MTVCRQNCRRQLPAKREGRPPDLPVEKIKRNGTGRSGDGSRRMSMEGQNPSDGRRSPALKVIGRTGISDAPLKGGRSPDALFQPSHMTAAQQRYGFYPHVGTFNNVLVLCECLSREIVLMATSLHCVRNWMLPKYAYEQGTSHCMVKDKLTKRRLRH